MSKILEWARQGALAQLTEIHATFPDLIAAFLGGKKKRVQPTEHERAAKKVQALGQLVVGKTPPMYKNDSLVTLIEKTLKGREPLSFNEVVEGVQKLGWQSSSKNPRSVVGVTLRSALVTRGLVKQIKGKKRGQNRYQWKGKSS